MFRGFLQFIAIIGTVFLAILVLFIATGQATIPSAVYQRAQPNSTTTTPLSATTSPVLTQATTTQKKTPLKKAVARAPTTQPTATTSQNTPSSNEVHRIDNPYPFPPRTAGDLDTIARAALVNIFCQTNGSSLNSISGSGTIIDPRGVILTNAHVAQYILLASDPQIDLQCYIRTGSPAEARWKASILYMPAAWVYEHAQDISLSHPKGTGEYDYALLFITGSVDGTPLPSRFPYLPFDTREAIAFTTDSVLLAGYPAEFAGGSATRSSLYPTSVFTQIGDLLTFNEKTVDTISLGSVALAQSGSSGGAVVNLWGQLVGLITTTSEGATTAERELRAITLSYVSRDLQRKTVSTLAGFLAGNVSAKAAQFMTNDAPALAKQIINYIQ